jgi:hypothetical protein
VTTAAEMDGGEGEKGAPLSDQLKRNGTERMRDGGAASLEQITRAKDHFHISNSLLVITKES